MAILSKTSCLFLLSLSIGLFELQIVGGKVRGNTDLRRLGAEKEVKECNLCGKGPIPDRNREFVVDLGRDDMHNLPLGRERFRDSTNTRDRLRTKQPVDPTIGDDTHHHATCGGLQENANSLQETLPTGTIREMFKPYIDPVCCLEAEDHITLCGPDGYLPVDMENKPMAWELAGTFDHVFTCGQVNELVENGHLNPDTCDTCCHKCRHACCMYLEK